MHWKVKIHDWKVKTLDVFLCDDPDRFQWPRINILLGSSCIKGYDGSTLEKKVIGSIDAKRSECWPWQLQILIWLSQRNAPLVSINLTPLICSFNHISGFNSAPYRHRPFFCDLVQPWYDVYKILIKEVDNVNWPPYRDCKSSRFER